MMGCKSHESKVGYPSNAAAQIARKQIRSYGRNKGKLRVYRCENCHWWFIATERPREARLRLYRDVRKAKGAA
jgi:hypothetical protein